MDLFHYIQIALISFLGLIITFCPKMYFSGPYYMDIKKNSDFKKNTMNVSNFLNQDQNNLKDDITIFEYN